MNFRAHVVPVLAAVLILMGSAANAQPLGSFRWQQQPYCNVITVNLVQAGTIYHLDGTDDQCGSATLASVSGLAFPNPDGSIGFGLTIVTSPGGAAVHLDAAMSLATLGGTWRDSSGQTGNWTLLAGPGLGGSPRPTPVPAFAGGITVGGSTITNVGTPASATDAANKGYVDGTATRAFSTASSGQVTLPPSATTTILSLNLGAGTYVVMGRGEINNNSTATTSTAVTCRLVAGSTTASIARNMFLGDNTTVGDSETGAAFLLHTFAAPGVAVMECTTSAAWVTGNVLSPQMVALKVQP